MSPGPCAGPGERNHRPHQLVRRGLLRLGQGALPRRRAATCPPRRWRGRLSSTGAWRSLPRTTSGLPRASARIRSRTRSSSGRSSRSCRDRAAGPSARPDRAPSWMIASRCRRSRGAGQPELMFPCLEFSDVCRCRDGGPLQRVSVHTDRNLPMTSRRVPDVVSPSDNARAAGRSIA